METQYRLCLTFISYITSNVHTAAKLILVMQNLQACA